MIATLLKQRGGLKREPKVGCVGEVLAIRHHPTDDQRQYLVKWRGKTWPVAYPAECVKVERSKLELAVDKK